jgi:hypothetical protein
MGYYDVNSQEPTIKFWRTNKNCICGGSPMKQSRMYAYLCACICSFVIYTANAALVSRLGGQAVYDTDLDITWIADFDLFQNNSFGLDRYVNLGIHPSDSDSTNNSTLYDTRATWSGALFWIDAMNDANYLGFNDWRLPTTLIPDASCTSDQAGTTPSGDSSGFNCTGSEMGHLHYNELGVAAGDFTGDSGNPAVHLFDGDNGTSTIDGFPYWTSAETSPGNAMVFYTTNGEQLIRNKTFDYMVIAVRDGDVGAVPLPATAWLFGSGLLGLVGIARRKKA